MKSKDIVIEKAEEFVDMVALQLAFGEEIEVQHYLAELMEAVEEHRKNDNKRKKS